MQKKNDKNKPIQTRWMVWGRRWSIACLALLSLSANVLASQAEAIRAELMNPLSTGVLVVAHRAAWKNAPENSLLSIQHAIDMGVDIVEIDIQRTKDDELILLHDSTLDRTAVALARCQILPGQNYDAAA